MKITIEQEGQEEKSVIEVSPQQANELSRLDTKQFRRYAIARIIETLRDHGEIACQIEDAKRELGRTERQD